jgi:5-methylcytosine-specific restriction endonuclease McrA
MTTMSTRYGFHWSRIRRAVKRQAEGRCQYCGSEHLVTVHHLDGNTRNHAPENLAVLCEPCHVFVHRTEKIE